MSEVKIIAASIVKFLKQKLQENTLSEGARESVEVGIQCIETAFGLVPGNVTQTVDLLQLLRQRPNYEADSLKNQANELMRAKRYSEALEIYNRAVELNPRSSVYLCNRAAAHFQLGDFEAAVADCTAALAIQPYYAKAYGRLGLALSALDQHREARSAYAQASRLDPSNESYRENVQRTDIYIAQQMPSLPYLVGVEGLLQNPMFINMAEEMFADPGLRDVLRGNSGGEPAQGINNLLQLGQALVHQLQVYGLARPGENPSNGNMPNENLPNQNAPETLPNDNLPNENPQNGENPLDENPPVGNPPDDNPPDGNPANGNTDGN
ncbi:hypothetical protein O0L34_g7615 [Tuta absoluta]|nr:hypothetical protein O0L34_g7615 [Tuta absoluta]